MEGRTGDRERGRKGGRQVGGMEERGSERGRGDRPERSRVIS